MKKTLVTKATWLGRRGETFEWRSGDAKSRRVNVLRWVDEAHEKNGGHPAGTVVIRHVVGDGRTRTFTEFETRTYGPGELSNDQVDAIARQMLRQRVVTAKVS